MKVFRIIYTIRMQEKSDDNESIELAGYVSGVLLAANSFQEASNIFFESGAGRSVSMENVQFSIAPPNEIPEGIEDDAEGIVLEFPKSYFQKEVQEPWWRRLLRWKNQEN